MSGFSDLSTENEFVLVNTAGEPIGVDSKPLFVTRTPFQNTDTAFIGTPKFEYDFDDINLPKYDEAFHTLSTKTTSGLLYGFNLRFNSSDVIVRLEIDGVEVFEFDCDDMDHLFREDAETYRDWAVWMKGDRSFLLKPQSPFRFNTSYSIKVKSNNSSNSRKLYAFQVNYEEL